jgi:hypothetical protein
MGMGVGAGLEILFRFFVLEAEGVPAGTGVPIGICVRQFVCTALPVRALSSC